MTNEFRRDFIFAPRMIFRCSESTEASESAEELNVSLSGGEREESCYNDVENALIRRLDNRILRWSVQKVSSCVPIRASSGMVNMIVLESAVYICSCQSAV